MTVDEESKSWRQRVNTFAKRLEKPTMIPGFLLGLAVIGMGFVRLFLSQDLLLQTELLTTVAAKVALSLLAVGFISFCVEQATNKPPQSPPIS